MITHLSLFSGIGGLDLAAEWAGLKTVAQCEWAEYPTKVLEKHWPDVPRWKDIRTLTGRSFYERTGLRTVDVISGGFPCQPFSIAGKQRGREDDRYLWPEMVRVIKELRPAWVIGENVAGIVRMALADILSELEACGYRTRAFLIPACAVGARHGDTGSQLWATPNTMDHLPQRSEEALRKQAGGSRKGRSRPANLREQVDPETVKMWPTPKASTRGGCPSERERKSPDLSAAVKMWPTPKANETGCYQMSGKNRDRKTLTLTGAVKMYNTPTAQDAKNSTLPESQINRDSLVGDVMREMFVTPQARDYRTGQASRWEDAEHRSRNLNDQVAMYPTPTTGAGLCGGTGNYQQLKRLEKNGTITEEERKSMSQGNGGQLNPDWVEWLMGFPVGWTEIS